MLKLQLCKKITTRKKTIHNDNNAKLPIIALKVWGCINKVKTINVILVSVATVNIINILKKFPM